MAHLGPDNKVTGRERERPGLGFHFYWGQGWGPRVLWAHSLLVNLEHKSGNLKCGKKKNQEDQMVSYQN